MKKIIGISCILIGVLGFIGCASNEKDAEETVANKTEEVKEEATKVVSDMDSKVEQTVKEVKEEVKEVVSETTDKVSSAAEEATENMTFSDYQGTESSRLTCTSGDDVRTISVLDGESGGCGVVYNKFSTAKTVATAVSDKNFCEGVQKRIQSNLETANFSCE